ncbi:GNAT family N-acetyltransferase [Sphingomonas swuensis]|uniref:GNAT family N-acetyltransferase n=1 Tax=Sphingomonas swuensis TaxID=977800 RepID=A0ABP7SMU7_9SPHN
MSGTAPLALTIVQAGGDELDEVMSVIERSFDPRFGEAWTRAQCAGILPMSGVSLLLARSEDEPVGFSLSRRVADEAELLLIGVVPEARGRGIAGALVDRFVADSRAAGSSHLHLEVRDGNPAVSLYRQHQFGVAGRRSKYYRGPGGELFDALTMVYTVEPQ